MIEFQTKVHILKLTRVTLRKLPRFSASTKIPTSGRPSEVVVEVDGSPFSRPVAARAPGGGSFGVWGVRGLQPAAAAADTADDGVRNVGAGGSEMYASSCGLHAVAASSSSARALSPTAGGLSCTACAAYSFLPWSEHSFQAAPISLPTSANEASGFSATILLRLVWRGREGRERESWVWAGVVGERVDVWVHRAA